MRWDFTATGDKPEQIYWHCDYLDANGFTVGEPERYVQSNDLSRAAKLTDLYLSITESS